MCLMWINENAFLSRFSQEHQLFRVFDALEFEDEESDKTEAIFSASGQLDQQQTQAVAPLVSFHEVLRGTQVFGYEHFKPSSTFWESTFWKDDYP